MMPARRFTAVLGCLSDESFVFAGQHPSDAFAVWSCFRVVKKIDNYLIEAFRIAQSVKCARHCRNRQKETIGYRLNDLRYH
jgi:hypothetical protein